MVAPLQQPLEASSGADHMPVATDDGKPLIRLIARLLPLLCIASGLIVLIARRTDQLTDPQVWGEEGTQIIPAFLEHGAKAFLIPVNGYLTTAPKLIAFLALAIGGLEHYPFVSTLLGLLFTASVFFWIGTAPLIVRGVALMPLAVALVPSDPEVLVVPLYTIWFAGLALSSLVLWKPEDRSRVGARVVVSLVCGLSTPVVIPLAVVGVLRALWIRARHETATAAALALAAVAQLWLLHAVPQNSSMPHPGEAVLVMARFLAYPLLLGLTAQPSPVWVWAIGAMHAVALFAVLVPKESRRRRLALFCLFVISAWTSIVRCQPPTIMHPVLAGPRYFFFPFVFLSWLWLDVLFSTARPAAKLVPAVAGALVLFSTSMHFNRRHAHLEWQPAVRMLLSQGHATLPVHSDGSLIRQWELKLAFCGDRLCQVR